MGEIIPVYRVIKNIGNQPGGAVAYKYFASANDIITEEDFPLTLVQGGSANPELALNVGQDNAATDYVQLPVSMPAGSYYIGCVVDPDNKVAELDEQNNYGATISPVRVVQSALKIATPQLPDAVLNRPYLFRFTAVGTTTTPTWSVDQTQGPLPAGLTLSTDGTLSGTPTTAAVTAFTVVVHSGGKSSAGRFALRVLPNTSALEVLTTTLPPIVRSATAHYETALAAAGGARPYQWRIVDGSLPVGIGFDAEGVLQGNVSMATPIGERRVVFEVVDGLGNKAQADLRVKVVEPSALSLKTLSLPDSLVNIDYVTDLVAENLDKSPLAKPLKWSVSVGALPEGLVLTTLSDERGILEGKPTVAGTFAFSIQVEDAKGRIDSADYVLRVYADRLRIGALDMPAVFHPGQEVSFSFTANTQGTQTRFNLFSGALPPGLALSQEGVVSGTVAEENAVGVYNIIVEARDSSGTGLSAFTLEVREAPPQAGCTTTSGKAGLWAIFLLPLLWLQRRRLAPRRPRRGLFAAVAGAALALPVAAAGQTITYEVSTGTSPFQPVSAQAKVLSGTSAIEALPFRFNFYGTGYTSITISQYGYAVFSGSATQSSNLGIPHSSTSSSSPQTMMAPWWDLLSKTAPAAVKVETQGTSPNQEFVVEWRDMSVSGSQTRATFQLRLQENTNRIRFAYANKIDQTAGTASVGIMRAVGDGVPALACTTSVQGRCSGAEWPENGVIDFFLPADLTIVSIAGDQTGYAGVPFRSAATLRNNGGRRSESASVRFYLSTDVQWDAGDTVLGTSQPRPLEAGQEILVTASGTIPSAMAQGNYYLLARADPDGLVLELDETNNTALPIPLRIGAPTPDLIVGSVTGPATAAPGQSIGINRTLANAGNAPLTTTFKYTFFLSENDVVTVSDRVLGASGTSPALAVNAVDSKQEDVALPTDLHPGKYWVGACVDYDPTATPTSTIVEISEVNNCATAPTPIVINTGGLTILTGALPGASQYAPFGLTFEAAGGDGAYVWTLAGGQLPPGMALSNKGLLLGTPASPGAFAFDVKVSSGGAEATGSYSIQVTPANVPLAIVDQDLPTAEFARAYAADLIAVGGKPPYKWAVRADSRMPAGLALATDGHVEGRAAEAGLFTFGVELTDAAGAKASKDLRVRVVTPSTMHIALARLRTGILGQSYTQPLQVVGGKGPFSWRISGYQQLAENETEKSGDPATELPAGMGLTIDAVNNTLAGVPAKAGLFAITLTVQDKSNGNEDSTTLPLRVTYDEALAITTINLPDAFIGHGYSARIVTNSKSGDDGLKFEHTCALQVQQDLKTYQCAPGTQELPPGLTIMEDGTLTGEAVAPEPSPEFPAVTESQPRVYSFLVKVTDKQGRQDVRGLSIKLRPDYEKGGCAGAPFAPSLLGLLAVAFAIRSRRRGR